MSFNLVICIFMVTFGSFYSNAIFADDWLQWRGPNRTDVSKETDLLDKWPEGGPKQIWTYDKGGLGYAGFAVKGEYLLTMGLEGSKEFLLCLDANTGEEKWRTNFASRYENGWGDGPRSTPTIDGDQVYALAAAGELVCCNLKNGKKRWSTNLTDLGGRVPGWGYSESPLVDGDRVLVTPGGKDGAIAAIDKTTGTEIWRSEDVTYPAHYSSIIKINVGGNEQYVQLFEKRVVGVNPNDGSLIWSSGWHGSVAVIPTPIYSDGKVYICSGYGAGCKMIKLNQDGTSEDLWQNRVMKNHHGGVILVDGHVYGFSDKVGWVCQNFETGEMVWKDKGIGKGAITYADGKFFCLAERSGKVAMIDAKTAGYRELGSFTLSPQTKRRNPAGMIWVHPVIANGKLYLRDQEIIHCYDVKNK